tara:strand:+ start:1355 stop:1954 length:600 start_codon:yes stop_codon:yes gene_type:complete
MAMEDNEFNEFESAIPGQSLVSGELGSVPFETPADYSDPDEYYMFLYEKFVNEEENAINTVRLLEMGITADAIVDGVLMNAFMMGQISADLGVIMKEPLTDLILLIGQEADIQVARRNEAEDTQRQTQVDLVLATLAEGEEGEEGMALDDDMMEEPSGMMAPPDGMDSMMPIDDDMMAETQEPVIEEEEEEEPTTLMMG